jgi:hypothetical protein
MMFWSVLPLQYLNRATYEQKCASHKNPGKIIHHRWLQWVKPYPDGHLRETDGRYSHRLQS